MLKKLAAEFIGTAWLVLGGCGAAVLAAAFPQLGIGFVGVALAFGLTVLTMAYAIGHVSGCHLNPAGVGRPVGRRALSGQRPARLHHRPGAGRHRRRRRALSDRQRQGRTSASPAGFASNGYGEHSPGGYGLVAAWSARS